VPITFAHPAAVLPFARTRLPLPALVIGSMVPDLPMFLRAPWYEVTHGPWGVFSVDIVLGMLGVALWVLVVRDALVDLAPHVIRGRLPRGMRFSRRDWWLAPPAACLGAVTHVVWDLFTHPDRWGSHHVPWLASTHAGLLGTAWLQHASSILATGVLVLVVVRHLRTLSYDSPPEPRRLPRGTAAVAAAVVAIVGVATVIAQWGRSLEVVAYNSVIITIDAAVAVFLILALVWRLAHAGLADLSGETSDD
jgi:hypothetical protein